jgi:F-box-like
VRFVGVGRDSVDDPVFQENVGCAISECQSELIVHEFKALWTFFEGNLISKGTRVRLADALDKLERQLALDEVGQHDATKEISRIFYISLPPQTIKALLIAPRIPYLEASGVVSIIIEKTNEKYNDAIANFKALFPEFRNNATEIAFRVVKAGIEEPVGRKCELPTELLVMIFTMTAQECGASPLVLRLVCSNWYRIVNNTPMLWTYLSMWDYPNSSTRLRYFLARSNPSKVHVGLVWCGGCDNILGAKHVNSCDCPDPTPLFEDCERIQCLRLEAGWMHRLSSLDFPSLQTLTLFNNSEPWYQPGSSMSLDISRFPTLKRLDLYAAGDGFVRDYLFWAGGPTYRLLLSPHQFPPIQILRLTADKNGYWTDIVTACSRTLVSLVVGVFLNTVVARHAAIHLPILKSLALHYYQEDAVTNDVAVHLSTPQLTYYCLKSTLHPVPHRITFDGTNIIQMRASQVMSALVWPRVLCLQIPCKDALLSRLDELGLCATVFPSLIRVEVLMCDSNDLPVCFAVSERVRNMGFEVGRNIRFVSGCTWLEKLYGYDGEETVWPVPEMLLHGN